MNVIKKSITNSRNINTVGAFQTIGTITKLFDRLLSRWLKLWNSKKITNTTTVPSIKELLSEERYETKLLEKPVRRNL